MSNTFLASIARQSPKIANPMTGTIDADCNVDVQLSSPLVREFQFTLDPNAMTGIGTYVDQNSSGCRTTYDLSMTLMPGHA